jgi:hypothetical protein
MGVSAFGWVDGSPARPTARGDVAGCVAVGVRSDAARPAEKPCLVNSVSLVQVPAFGAGLGGIGAEQRFNGEPLHRRGPAEYRELRGGVNSLRCLKGHDALPRCVPNEFLMSRH